MAITIKTVYPSGRTLKATLERLDTGYFWDNVDTAWEAAPSHANQEIALTESVDPALMEYSGSPTGNLGSPGRIRIRIFDDDAGSMPGLGETDVMNNVEVFPLLTTAGLTRTQVDSMGSTAVATLATVTDAIHATLVDDFAAIPAAVNTKLVEEHNDGNWTSTLGSGPDSVTLTVLCDGVAVPNAKVWVTNNSTGTDVESSVTTDVSGQAVVSLTDGQTYYCFIQATGYNSMLSEEFEANVTAGNEFTITEVEAVAGAGTSLYTLMSFVQPFVRAEDSIIQLALRVASKEFFDRTGAWTETQTTTLVAADPVLPQQLEGDTFHLLTSYEAVTRRVKYVREATTTSPITETTSRTDESEYRVTADEHIVFTSDRDAGAVLEIEKTMTPKTNCVTFPAELITRWGYALANGALSKIYRMPQFANASFYQLYAGAFEQDIADAAVERIQARKSGMKTLSMPNTFR